jgi:hypothetical protein
MDSDFKEKVDDLQRVRARYHSLDGKVNEAHKFYERTNDPRDFAFYVKVMYELMDVNHERIALEAAIVEAQAELEASSNEDENPSEFPF